MKLMKLKTLAAALAMAASFSASADLITFSPTGTVAGNIGSVATFDWAPGSALADQVNNIGLTAGIVQGTNFNTYYQANLSIIQDGTPQANTLFTNGDGGKYFTAVAGFGETVTSCNGPPCTLATFGFTDTLPNFFKIFAVTGLANNLTGAGFTAASAILTGHVVSAGFGSIFSVTSPTGGLLDQNQGVSPGWAGVQTVSGVGSSAITIVIDSVNTNYFSDLLAGNSITFSFFNTNQNLAFRQVDPSLCLSNGLADCAINSGVGTYNGGPTAAGGGNDVLFQADANQSFQRTPTIPEPGSLALVGLGLIGLVTAGRRRGKAAQK